MRNSQAILNVSSSMYASILRLYPMPYRQRFSDEMVQVFTQVCRHIYHEGGLLGLMVLWLVTVANLMKTVIEERFNEVMNMNNKQFIRVGGWALILIGLLLVGSIVEQLTNRPSTGFAATYGPMQTIFWYGGGLFLAVGLAALYGRYSNVLSMLARFALLAAAALSLVSAVRIFWLPTLNAMALSGSALESLDYAVFLVGFGSSLLALLVFGIEAAAKAGTPNWRYVAAFTGGIGVLFVIAALLIPPASATLSVFLAGGAVIGVGISAVGFMLQRDVEIVKPKPVH